jgi:hypothetical protein
MADMRAVSWFELTGWALPSGLACFPFKFEFPKGLDFVKCKNHTSLSPKFIKILNLVDQIKRNNFTFGKKFKF